MSKTIYLIKMEVLMKKKILMFATVATLSVAMTACGTVQTRNNSTSTVEPTKKVEATTAPTVEPTTELIATSTPTPEPTEIPWNATDVSAFEYRYFNMKEHDFSYKEEADCIAIIGIIDENLTSIAIPKTINGLPVKIIIDLGGHAPYWGGPVSDTEDLRKFVDNPVRNITNIAIPDTIIEIGDGAFRYCTGLTEIILPHGLTKIGEDAFEGCSSLINIVIPDTVKEVGAGAFSECSSLKEVTLSNRQTVIREDTFYKCISLAEINFSETIKVIEYRAFSGCSSLVEVKLPSQVETIEMWAFSGCDELAVLWIPESAKEIHSAILSWSESPIVVYAPKDSYAETWAKEQGHAVIDYTPEE
ncbi:MAG: hypothetical protein E7267_08235 [Lachnospiraceae bacterium]|nr:hypothetical protein [Lachnospiraceae bacterium]